MLDLLQKLLPAYSYILLGFIARRWLGISQHYIAKILFYLCIPIIVFKSTFLFTSGNFFLLTALSFFVSCLMSISAQWLAPKSCTIFTLGVCQCLYGYFNIAWFGIPVVYVLYGNTAVVTMIPFYIGGMLFGNTLGYLLVAQSTFSITSPLLAIKKLCTVPAFYALIAGLILNNSDWRNHFNNLVIVSQLFQFSTIATTILGMGLVGMSIAHVSIHTVPWRQILKLLYSRFLSAVVIVGIIATSAWKMDYLNFFEFKIFLLLPLLPIAANILVFAEQTERENSALGVTIFISTMMACLLFLSGSYLLQ